MWVFGNGESRKDIDLNKILDQKIGCNAIFRDYTVDHLICVDRRMVKEALDAEVNNLSLLYTRKDWLNNFQSFKRIRIVPELPYAGSERWDNPFHWGSGPYAVLLAAKLCKEKQVNLLGFDLYSRTNNVNNIYKDTNNYDCSEKRAVDPRYWIHQIGKVFECFPKVQFIIYQEDGWQLPKAWKHTNVKVDSISNIYYNT